MTNKRNMNTVANIKFTEQKLNPIWSRIQELKRELRQIERNIIDQVFAADFLAVQISVDSHHSITGDILKAKLDLNQLQRAFVADQFKKHFNNH